MEYVIVYMTAADLKEAKKIQQVLVAEKLAACVNILSELDSFYWWKGKKEGAKEIAVIAKTRKGLVDKLTKRVKEIHSYEVPCVVAFPIIGGNQDFLKWIGENTK